MNVPGSDARASSFFFWRRIADVFSQVWLSINSDHLHSATNMRCERVRARMQERRFKCAYSLVLLSP